MGGLDDSDEENTETYTVSVGGQSGTGSITDADSVSIASVSDDTRAEGEERVHILTLTGA